MSNTITKSGYLAGATRFRRISEKLYYDGDKIYKDQGLNFKASWFSIYYTLVHAPLPLSVLELSSEIGFTHITVKNVLRELEAEGLAEVLPHPTDKRSKQVTLSKKGRELVPQLEIVWENFSRTLQQLLNTGHPDFINIINRIDKEIEKNPIHERIKTVRTEPQVAVIDYRPELKQHFFDLAGGWLLDVLNGQLEKDDVYTLKNPDMAYLSEGGFVFFAMHNSKVVGCVALKRLSDNAFEFCKLYVDKEARNLGVATRLIERCISRCKENNATRLWLQTTNDMKEAHKLYYKLGFTDENAPKEMTVLSRTERVMGMDL